MLAQLPTVRLGVLLGGAALALAAATTFARTSSTVSQSPSSAPAAAVPGPALSEGSIPVVKEHRYRMSAKIRPLLLFWIGKDNVGGARARWRQGANGERGYDLLIGSDPKRAPRQVNRWGFILEESRGPESTVLGVIRKGEDESLEAAKADVGAEGTRGYGWKMIQGRSDAQQCMATVTTTQVPANYSYRDLDRLLDALVKFPGPPNVKKIGVPPGGRAGFLTALADLVRDTVEAVRRDGRAPGRKSLPYAYFGKHYDLTRTGASIKSGAQYGGTTYPRLVEASFQLRARGADWTESFTLALGLEGPLAEVPVFASYQPKWWFKADMVLDDRETF